MARVIDSKYIYHILNFFISSQRYCFFSERGKDCVEVENVISACAGFATTCGGTAGTGVNSTSKT